MGFSTNFSEATQFDLIPEGTYECVITDIEERTTPNGAMGLNFAFTIRNDVEQTQQNRRIFHTFWKRREPTQLDKQVNGYSFNQLMGVASSAKLQDGKDYADMNEFLADLQKKCVKITLEHQIYNGKTRENAKYINASDFPECKHIFKDSTPKNDTYAPPKQEQFAAVPTPSSLNDFEEIGDGEVPF